MPKSATPPGAPARAIDWEAIEGEYRAGVLSIREIAKRFNVCDGAIRKHAKAHDWQRDLTKQVNAAVRTQLVRTEVRTGNVRTERELVDAAADTVVQVVKHHRRDIAQGRTLLELLFGQLTAAATERDAVEDAVIAETKEDANAARRAQMFKAVSLPTHAATMRDLAQALRHVVVLERQAYSLDDRAPEEPEQGAQLTAKVAGKILTDLNALAAG